MDLELIYKPIDEIIPYAKNSRTHSKSQVAQIAASIKEFGFTNPILIDPEGSIIAGHGRLEAARVLDLDKVPTICLADLTDEQKRAYVIADNKLALNAGWDVEMLKLELETLRDEGFDLSVVGFDEKELSTIFEEDENPYANNIEAPCYEPTGVKPDVSELFDDSKTKALMAEIRASDLPEEEKDFLIAASGRHTVLNFQSIAEYYAHSDPETQDLMEKNALVIIDFDKAIENGYIKMCLDVNEAYDDEHPDEG